MNNFLSNILKTKSPDELIASAEKSNLKRTLSAFDLIMLGVGAVIGTGIFTLSGVAIAGEASAGPSFMISIIFAGVACIFAAFSYAEFASIIPVAGSAYTYVFSVFGQFAAWLIGWILMLEYAIGNITVAIAFSGYWFEFVKGFEKYLPYWIVNKSFWVHEYMLFGKCSVLINVPAIIVVCIITYLLYKGISESAKSATIMVFIKLTVIFLFIIGGAFYVRPENWTPFATNGLAGIYQGAFLIFLAYIGFDAISTVAEETKNPQVNMPIGIIGTLFICMVVYVLVAAVLTGMFPFSAIKGNEGFIAAPIAYSLRTIGRNYMALLVSLGSLAGLFSVLLVLQLGGSRILFSMSRDRLLPSVFSKVHKKYQTPFVITLLLGFFVVIGTCFFDLEASAHLCNIGTITSFIAVSLGVIAFRYKDPNRKRLFKIPFMPLIPLLGVISCLWIVIKGVPQKTFIFYLCWIFIGIIIYTCYGYRKANLK